MDFDTELELMEVEVKEDHEHEPEARVGGGPYQDQTITNQFIDKVITSRTNEPRNRPWFKTLPVRTLIKGMYTALSKSQYLDPFQLIELGKLVISLMTMSQVQGPDADADFYSKTLERISLRLISLQKRGNEQDMEQCKLFLDRVWELHTKGDLDLSKTKIPASLASSSSCRLQLVLSSCFDKDSDSIQSLSPLLSLCQDESSFLQVQELLVQKPNPLTLGRLFQEQLKNKLNLEDYISLFPTPFHPFLYFLSCFDNPSEDLVVHQLLNLLDTLIYQCQRLKMNQTLVPFLLLTIPNVPISKLFHRQRYPHWLWIKINLKRSEEYKSLLNLASVVPACD